MVMFFGHLAKECCCLYCWVQEHKCSACPSLLWVKLCYHVELIEVLKIPVKIVMGGDAVIFTD